MFVTAAARLAVPTAVAQHRLLTVLHADGGLQDAAAAAFRAGETVLLRAGFAGVSNRSPCTASRPTCGMRPP